ncbi:MAG: hypothetical protein RLZZ86_1197, partial [Cyanobacteriota bacterium]
LLTILAILMDYLTFHDFLADGNDLCIEVNQ